MKVSELEGPLLDYWVGAACSDELLAKLRATRAHKGHVNSALPWRPSTDWSQGGIILERMRIGFNTWHGDWGASFTFPVRHPTNPKRDPSHHWMKGPTPLIAAMRTYVSSVYGDEVPEEDQ